VNDCMGPNESKILWDLAKDNVVSFLHWRMGSFFALIPTDQLQNAKNSRRIFLLFYAIRCKDNQYGSA